MTTPPAEDRGEAETSFSIWAEIEGLLPEQVAGQAKIAAAQERRRAALLSGAAKEIRAADQALGDAELAAESIDIRIADLRRRHTDAAADEAAERRVIQFREAAEAIERFNAWFATEYGPAARALVVGLELERHANLLREQLRDRRSMTLEPGLPVPRLAWVGVQARSLGFLARLPAADQGDPPLWWPTR